MDLRVAEKIASVRIQVGIFDVFASFASPCEVGISKRKFLSRLVLDCLRFVQFSRLSVCRKKSCDQIKNVRVSAARSFSSQREIFVRLSFKKEVTMRILFGQTWSNYTSPKN